VWVRPWRGSQRSGRLRACDPVGESETLALATTVPATRFPAIVTAVVAMVALGFPMTAGATSTSPTLVPSAAPFVAQMTPPAAPGIPTSALPPRSSSVSVERRLYAPPASIADDCSTDVADALRSWIMSLPSGTPTVVTVVTFAPRACYLVNESLFLRDLADVVIEGNGATFRQVAPTTENIVLAGGVAPYAGSANVPIAVAVSIPIAPDIWWFDGGSDITVENLIVEGPNTGGGGTSGGGTMIDSGIQLYGVQRALVQNNTVKNVDGDFVTISGLYEASDGGGGSPSTDVTVVGNTFDISGRQGITPEFVDRVSITGNTFSGVTATSIDMESDNPTGGGCSCNVSVTNNTFSGSPYLIAALTDAAVNDFAFTGNTLVGGGQMKVDFAPALTSGNIVIAANVGIEGSQWPFASVLVGNGPQGDSAGAIDSVEISGNTVPANTAGGSFVFDGANVAGVAVRNNTLATSGTLVPLAMDGSQTQGSSCGNSTISGGAPVDGPCAGTYVPPLPPGPPSLPVADPGTPPLNPLQITSMTSMAATQGGPFAAALSAVNGVERYSWAVVSGSVPSGLMLDPSSGVIAGTPTVAGTSSFTVRATDAIGETADTDLSMFVASPTFGQGVPTTPVNAPQAPLTGRVVGMSATPTGDGYWIADASGGIVVRGSATFYGSMAGATLDAPVAHVIATADGRGYWLVAADGGLFAFGDAQFFGSMGGRPLNAPIIDMAPTADDQGYWLVASDGGVFAFGDAAFRGSMGGTHLNKPVVAVALDAETGGYWEVASDGGIFAFGAPFLGSTASLALEQPINGIAVSSDDSGYWLVAADGGIFACGAATFLGSAVGLPLDAPIVGAAADPESGGYWEVASDGGIFAYGAPFYGAG
jgi:Putative Ig domain